MNPRPALLLLAALSLAAAAPADDLQARLLRRVTFRPDADPRAEPALRAGLESVLRAPTGRRLAEEFVAEGRTGTIGFAAAGDAHLADEGRGTDPNAPGSGGYSSFRDGVGAVWVNRKLLAAGPGDGRAELERVLAHELFGHMLSHARAVQAGVPEPVFGRFRDDEANACLVGWLVQAELGGKLDNALMWDFLEDREKFFRGVRFQGNVDTLSLAQMKDPRAAWREGLEAARAATRRQAEFERRDDYWTKVVDHFEAEHAIAPDKFRTIRDSIRVRREVSNPALRDHAARAEAEIRARVETASKDGRLVAALQAAAGSPFMAAFDGALDDEEGGLRRLVGTRTRDAETAPPGGQITWPELQRMWAKDLPAHRARLPWKKPAEPVD